MLKVHCIKKKEEEETKPNIENSGILFLMQQH